MNGPVIQLAASLGCLAVGSLLAGADAVMAALPEPRLRALRDELAEDRRGPIDRFLRDPEVVIARLLAARVVFLMAGALLATDAVGGTRADPERHLVLIACLAATYGVLSELMVSVGRARARRLAPVVLRWTRPLEWLVLPLAVPLVALGRAARKRMQEDQQPDESSTLTEREVEYLVEAAENAGTVDRKRGQMMLNVLELKELTARELMVPRTKATIVESDEPVSAVLQRMLAEGRSRAPVYRGSVDNVVGLVHVKDLFELTQRKDGAEAKVVDGLRPCLLVPGQQSALQVLRELQQRRTHMAVVLDEFGGFAGLLTLEDVLEELVGDIQDEHDREEAPIKAQPDGSMLASAEIPLAELAERLGVSFPEEHTYTTLGGFLASRAGRVPVVGSALDWEGFVFTVREGDARHITRVLIHPPPEAETRLAAE